MIYKERLKNIREENEVKQQELADLLDVHFTAYSQFEREYTIIPIKHLNTICNFFNISLDYIFGFTNEKNYDNNKKEIDIELSGERLKNFRKENKITQEKLASILNTTQSNIVGYEKGKFLIATPYLYEICEKYKISADYLMGKIK